MENPRPEKVSVVDEVKQRFSESNAALVTEYRGMKVSQLSDLRRAIRGNDAEFKVYKNTLVRRAAVESGIDGADELFVGPTAIAFVKGDAAAVAKQLRDHAKTNPLLIVKGGVLGSKVLTAQQVQALADLPSREVLLSQIAGAFKAPATKMAGLLAAVPRNFAYGLKALIDQGGASAATAPASQEN
jgi:large subunit ribosomal protein L10